MWGLFKGQMFGLQLRVGDGTSALLTSVQDVLPHGVPGAGPMGNG